MSRKIILQDGYGDSLNPEQQEIAFFLRDEMEFERKRLEVNEFMRRGFEERKRNFERIRPVSPDPQLIDMKIAETHLEIEKLVRQDAVSIRSLENHAQLLGTLLEGKTKPPDVVNFLGTCLRDHQRLLKGGR